MESCIAAVNISANAIWVATKTRMQVMSRDIAGPYREVTEEWGRGLLDNTVSLPALAHKNTSRSLDRSPDAASAMRKCYILPVDLPILSASGASHA